MAGFDESGFLDMLYGAAITPGLWTPVMERLSDLVGGSAASLSRFDVTTGLGPVITARSDPAAYGIYSQHFASANPLNNVADTGAYRRNWRAAILTDEDWMAKDEFVRTEYYNDFLRPLRRHSVMFIRLALDGNRPSVINVARPPEREQFGAAEVEAVSRLHEHLIRAFELGRRLEAERSVSESAATLFDKCPHGVFLLGDGARLLRASPAGEAMLAGGGVLTVQGGRLTARGPAAARRLEGLLAAAATADPARRSAGSMALAAPGRTEGLSVTVAPARVEESGLFDGGPRVMVCVTDPEADVRPPEETLRELFGLTRSEAKLALALSGGDSLSEAAQRHGVSLNTARVHLSRVFDKTGVNRQGALVALLTRCAGPGLYGRNANSAT
jgi:DNA-binding CsgD family transcriptional regulator